MEGVFGKSFELRDPRFGHLPKNFLYLEKKWSDF